ncbi:MAG: bifunctional diaminohydroxyphosphoribosylaminopyrimidine deaminase/5-amino-6-(5-phosphoribosylamino)uracil reductase RibD [Elusimicrobiota bacterium]
MNLDHSHFMRRALALAEQGRLGAHPNPCVGAVVVKNGKIIAEGYHKTYGGPHAEVLALSKLKKKANGATLYLTLEPCTHFGKTPPCLPLVQESGVKEVFIATRDPNPRVSGKGVLGLKKAKIKVSVGLEEENARILNRSFFTAMKLGRPHVILKVASSLDGKIATSKGDSQWISSVDSRSLVHTLRAESDAVLIGVGTAIKDNPTLTSHGKGRNPLRIILDPHLRAPLSLQLFNDQRAPTMVICSPSASAVKAKRLEKKGVQILRNSLKYGFFELSIFLKNMFKINVNQLLIESGNMTSWGFLQQRFIDEVYWFLAPLIIGGKTSIPSVGGPGVPQVAKAIRLKSWSYRNSGNDLLIHGSFH